MPRYFFNLSNHNKFWDPRGAGCSTLEEAKAFAEIVAAEYGRNQPANALQGKFICITDEEGREVSRTPLVNLQRTVDADEILREIAHPSK